MSEDINRQPSFSDRERGDGSTALECPNCGSDWLHQQRVSVFRRHTEDDERGLAVTVDADERLATVGEKTSREYGNPSARRGGIRIQFSCEECSPGTARYELVLKQHKGNEFVHWETLGDN